MNRKKGTYRRYRFIGGYGQYVTGRGEVMEKINVQYIEQNPYFCLKYQTLSTAKVTFPSDNMLCGVQFGCLFNGAIDETENNNVIFYSENTPLRTKNTTFRLL